MKTTIKQYWAFAIAALTVLATACGGAKKFDLVCEPGETGQPVTCADKTQGFLKCNARGTAFTETTCVTGQQPSMGCGSVDAKCCLGQTISCGCTDGRTGSQMCKSDCSGFDACLCTGPVPGAGGNVGTGGTTGAGGSNVGGSSTGGSSGVGGSTTGGSAGSPSGGSAGTGGTSGAGGTGGSSTGCSNPNKACNFGEVFACHCVQNGQVLDGQQGCESDCSARTECVCQASDAGTGGTGGTGGAGGSSGQGGTSGTGGTSSTGGSGGSSYVCGDQSKRLCVPGQDNLCHCLVNDQVVNGVQLCNVNCDGWTTCSCGTGGQGGSSGQGGTGGSAGSGGSATQVDVACSIRHTDNTQFKFDQSAMQFSSQMHNYRVFVSDLGVDSQGIYAGDHVKWGEDAKLHVQQFGNYVTISFLSTLGSVLNANATRDPVGTDESSANYWREPASDRNPLAPRMLWECTVTVNGITSHMQWPTAIDTGTGTNLRLVVRPIVTSANDEDGDGAVKGEDCDDTPNTGFFKRGSPLADKNLWLPEVEQDGIDNDCVNGDLKYRRAVMNASSGLGTPMVFWDSWKYGVTMSFASSLWASTYVPSNLMPKDKMSGQSVSQPAGLVHFYGSGTGCYQGECWNMYKNNGTCTDVYPVYLETPDHLQFPSTSALNADGQCRVFFAAAQ